MPAHYLVARWLFRALLWYRGRAFVIVELWGRDGFNDDFSHRPGLYAAYDRFMHRVLFAILIGAVAGAQNWILGFVSDRLTGAALTDWMKGIFR